MQDVDRIVHASDTMSLSIDDVSARSVTKVAKIGPRWQAWSVDGVLSWSHVLSNDDFSPDREDGQRLYPGIVVHDREPPVDVSHVEWSMVESGRTIVTSHIDDR